MYMILYVSNVYDIVVYQEMLQAGLLRSSFLDALPSLEHRTDPARWRIGDVGRDVEWFEEVARRAVGILRFSVLFPA